MLAVEFPMEIDSGVMTVCEVLLAHISIVEFPKLFAVEFPVKNTLVLMITFAPILIELAGVSVS